MKYICFFLVLFLLAACKVGNFPQERISLYEANKIDCHKEPQKCINGYPW